MDRGRNSFLADRELRPKSPLFFTDTGLVALNVMKSIEIHLTWIYFLAIEFREDHLWLRLRPGPSRATAGRVCKLL